LIYGLGVLMHSRPVWLAFEGDRYRVVSQLDFTPEALLDAKSVFRDLSLTGPRLIGVNLVQPTDKLFLQSIQLSLQGYHPAFRPKRWTEYSSQLDAVQSALRPLSLLFTLHPKAVFMFNKMQSNKARPYDDLGFLPLVAPGGFDWVVIVDRKSGVPVLYLPLDGWAEPAPIK